GDRAARSGRAPGSRARLASRWPDPARRLRQPSAQEAPRARGLARALWLVREPRVSRGSRYLGPPSGASTLGDELHMEPRIADSWLRTAGSKLRSFCFERTAP